MRIGSARPINPLCNLLSPPDRRTTIRGTSFSLIGEVNSQTGTILLVGEFPNPGGLLRPGQFGRIRAKTSIQHDALLIPQQAVSELQGRYQVDVVDADNKVACPARARWAIVSASLG